MNCEKIFNYLVDELSNYLTKNNLKSMILGISGGIDSTVVAAICHEVSNCLIAEAVRWLLSACPTFPVASGR